MSARAPLEKTEHGLTPASEGWFVLHASEAAWSHSDRFGQHTRFENLAKARFTQLGVNIHIIAPGQPACLYHRENAQENFLVLSGACKVLIEEEEIELRAGHFVHCPAGATHVFVGAGDGPCVLLMMGHRPPQEEQRLHYPVSELAAKHGASSEAPADDPREAYEGTPMPTEIAPPAWPLW